MTVPAYDAATSPVPDAPSGAAAPTALETLRGAVADLPPAHEHAEPFDAAEHAARFEAVHDALVAVLTDVDRT